MKNKTLLNSKEKVFSFEFFPPKNEKGEENLFIAIEELKKLSPDYVSVTYGALGSSQDKSLSITRKIQNEIGLNVMAHYTCIGATHEKVDAFLKDLEDAGVVNILALRGDAPHGMDISEALKESPFNYATDLVRYIREKTGEKFSIGVAGYPERHPECSNFDEDLKHLKEKVDAGADFIVTQLFFDNKDFFTFKEKAEESGINVPIIPGIIPIENYNQIQKITSLCGAKVPEVIKENFSDETLSEEDKLAFGLDYTTKQCEELLDAGVRGIHFYTLNKSVSTREIFTRLKLG